MKVNFKAVCQTPVKNSFGIEIPIEKIGSDPDIFKNITNTLEKCYYSRPLDDIHRVITEQVIVDLYFMEYYRKYNKLHELCLCMTDEDVQEYVRRKNYDNTKAASEKHLITSIIEDNPKEYKYLGIGFTEGSNQSEIESVTIYNCDGDKRSSVKISIDQFNMIVKYITDLKSLYEISDDDKGGDKSNGTAESEGETH